MRAVPTSDFGGRTRFYARSRQTGGDGRRKRTTTERGQREYNTRVTLGTLKPSSLSWWSARPNARKEASNRARQVLKDRTGRRCAAALGGRVLFCPLDFFYESAFLA
jgi:hypothetical protein